MHAASPVATPDAEAFDDLLPRELIWFYLVAPWVSAPVLIHTPFAEGVTGFLQAVLANYVPFLAIPAACHALYRWVMPSLLRRTPPGWRRYTLHAVALTAVAVVAGTVVAPLCLWLKRPLAADPSLAHFLFVCVIVTWTFTLPALVVQQLRHRAREVERRALVERQAALEAQLSALQARTNPHFFFNSINTVASLIPEQPRLAELTLERMAEIFRYALASSSTRFVPLAREVAIVQDYLEVQAARFGDRLAYEVTLDPGAADVPVPPLVLQPLVENAVVHGVTAHAQGGRIRVDIKRAPGGVEIGVSDDGPGPGGSSHRGTGTSIRDLRERLAIVYGAAGHLATGPAPGGGFLAHLSLPLAPETAA